MLVLLNDRQTVRLSVCLPVSLSLNARDTRHATTARGACRAYILGGNWGVCMFTNDMLLPLPSYLAAVVEATGVLLRAGLLSQLSHTTDTRRQHAHASLQLTPVNSQSDKHGPPRSGENRHGKRAVRPSGRRRTANTHHRARESQQN